MFYYSIAGLQRSANCGLKWSSEKISSELSALNKVCIYLIVGDITGHYPGPDASCKSCLEEDNVAI